MRNGLNSQAACWTTGWPRRANLLQDELDAEPGMRLRLDLPAHWKSVILALAAWQLGMEVVFDDAEADLLATDGPGPGAAAGGFDAVMAVSAAGPGHAVAG